MTKRREPLTYQHTLAKVGTAIGWERAGAICGVTARAIRYWSDHDCETEIRMIDAERLDAAFLEAGGDHAPFHRLMSLRLEIADLAPVREDLTMHAAEAAVEAGQAVAAVLAAAGDPASAEKRRAARQEVQEAIDALTDCAADLKEGGTSI
jgi:hypothetical protein